MTGIGFGCDSCDAPKNTWTNLDAIERGFPKNRSFESVKQTWESLDKDETGQVKKRRDDFATRKGLCHEPQTLRETYSFTRTHKVGGCLTECYANYLSFLLKWMCVVNHSIKVVIHLMKGHHNWIEDATIKTEMKAGKEVVQQVLKPNQCPGGSKEDNMGK